jgi:hypothetical protein
MDEDITPPTEPSGQLVPPSKVPPTAVAAATQGPVPQRGSQPYLVVQSPLWRLMTLTLDVVDELADAVASGLGLRNG